jgi:hypothetical protein
MIYPELILPLRKKLQTIKPETLISLIRIAIHPPEGTNGLLGIDSLKREPLKRAAGRRSLQLCHPRPGGTVTFGFPARRHGWARLSAQVSRVGGS